MEWNGIRSEDCTPKEWAAIVARMTDKEIRAMIDAVDLDAPAVVEEPLEVWPGTAAIRTRHEAPGLPECMTRKT